MATARRRTLMDLLVHTLLSNALAATFMAVIAAGLAWILPAACVYA